MIRRDYFMRMVQELAQALVRVLGLKQRGEYQLAQSEIDRALKKIWDIDPKQAREMSLDDWIARCRDEGASSEQTLVALADVLREQGDLCALAQASDESQQSRALSLGLYLEALNSGVSVDLLNKVALLIEQTREGRLPGTVLRRLLSYYEARGRFASAEDTLFTWLETGGDDVLAEGEAFYARLKARPDSELASGDLPRDEVEQGNVEFRRRADNNSGN